MIGALAAVALATTSAWAGPHLPPKHQTFFGYTDTGELGSYARFSHILRKHPAVLATFDNWGTGKIKSAFDRWGAARARPMLTIQTGPGYQTPTPISPRDIAMGEGDAYLIFLNRMFRDFGRPAYVRAMPEPNGYWNPYSPYNSDRTPRGPENKQGWYRLAWRRMVILIRDGGTKHRVNQRLAGIGLPPIQKSRGHRVPDKLASPPVAFVWVPQTFGSPDIPSNRPRHFWPGRNYVNWIGADFYSKFQTWWALDRFYRSFGRKPFAFGEWGVWGVDDPTFVRRFFKWQRSHKRVRMMVYYNGGLSGGDNPFDIGLFPRSQAVLRKQLDRRGYPGYAPEWRRTARREKANRRRR